MKLECSQSLKRVGGRAREKSVRPACYLVKGGGNAVQADIQDRLVKVLRHESKHMGAHYAQTIILFNRSLVGGVIQVPEVNGGERGEMFLKLRLSCAPERHV